ncbi:MerR family transcriptional regulator [Algirhabdus cladophorae]|uniref:MerR family transcriptional regulator n=1 Tax=Algirhabdus cladophorae TaxID=3377108 RepID=UPI003B8481E6
MAKSADAFRTISEVADWLELPTHVLRFWESKFSQVKPVKRAGGRRYYRPNDMLLLAGIKHLLHVDGMTIKAVQQKLRSEGAQAVAAFSPPLEGSDPSTLMDDFPPDATPADEQVSETKAAEPVEAIPAEDTTIDAPDVVPEAPVVIDAAEEEYAPRSPDVVVPFSETPAAPPAADLEAEAAAPSDSNDQDAPPEPEPAPTLDSEPQIAAAPEVAVEPKDVEPEDVETVDPAPAPPVADAPTSDDLSEEPLVAAQDTPADPEPPQPALPETPEVAASAEVPAPAPQTEEPAAPEPVFDATPSEPAVPETPLDTAAQNTSPPAQEQPTQRPAQIDTPADPADFAIQTGTGAYTTLVQAADIAPEQIARLVPLYTRLTRLTERLEISD